MPVGNPADPLYAPYNKKRGMTDEEREAVQNRMKQEVDVELETIRQENLNRIFAKLSELREMIDGGKGDFPIKVSTGANGFTVSIDPSVLPEGIKGASLQLQDRCVNGFAGQQQVLGFPPVPIAAP